VGEVVPIRKPKTLARHPEKPLSRTTLQSNRSSLTLPSKPEINLQIRHRKPIAPPTQEHSPWLLSDAVNTSVSSETRLFYCKNPLPQKYLRKFKQGQLPIEATLDLHGLTSAESKETLIHFIQTQQQRGKRQVLVIHGKGRDTHAPILKNLVNHWLPQIPEILAFSSARPQNGGAGALYVLLKARKR
ncbi:MAG: Smr/MutS family protein, partial [Legionellaceae bacterium]|nr:Smr/MutS family protein [Legionellaceae bacterium]